MHKGMTPRRTEGGDSHLHAQEGGLRRIQPAQTLNSDVQTPGLRNKSLVFEAPCLWCFVTQLELTDAQRRHPKSLGATLGEQAPSTAWDRVLPSPRLGHPFSWEAGAPQSWGPTSRAGGKMDTVLDVTRLEVQGAFGFGKLRSLCIPGQGYSGALPLWSSLPRGGAA